MTAEWSRHLQCKLGEVKRLDNQYAWCMHCGLRLADGGMTRRLASVRVFLTNPVTKRCQRCRAMNFPFGRNQTKPNNNNNNNNNNNKTCREKEDGKLITAATNNYVQFSSNISLNSRYKPSSTSFKQHLLTDVTGKYFKDL